MPVSWFAPEIGKDICQLGDVRKCRKYAFVQWRNPNQQKCRGKRPKFSIEVQTKGLRVSWTSLKENSIIVPLLSSRNDNNKTNVAL